MSDMATTRVVFTDRHGQRRTAEPFTRTVPDVLAALERLACHVVSVSAISDSPLAPDRQVGDTYDHDGRTWEVFELTAWGSKARPL
jgi:hypothetical protein